jgi:DNA repair protein RecO (recombination protein O)
VPLLSTPAIVLQAFPYSETSKILRLLTPGHGVTSVIAKGAQRPKSRFGGLLEIFTEGDATIFFKEGRDLHTLAGFDLVKSRQALGHDLVAFAGGSLLAELVLRFGTAEPQPTLFVLISTALSRLVAAEPTLRQETVIADAWLLISFLGFRPQTEICVSCGESVPAASEARFDAEGGGIACVRCRPTGRPFDAVSRAELRAMLAGEPVTEPFGDPSLQRALLRVFLTSHLTREHSLRSMDLFIQQIS